MIKWFLKNATAALLLAFLGLLGNSVAVQSAWLLGEGVPQELGNSSASDTTLEQNIPLCRQRHTFSRTSSRGEASVLHAVENSFRLFMKGRVIVPDVPRHSPGLSVGFSVPLLC